MALRAYEITRPLALDQLTVIGARPAELVDLAAGAGFAAISPWLAALSYAVLPAAHLRVGDPETVAIARRMKETGVTLNQADSFALGEEAPMDAYRNGIALMAEVGIPDCWSICCTVEHRPIWPACRWAWSPVRNCATARPASISKPKRIMP